MERSVENKRQELKVVAAVAVRMGSERFPGKALFNFSGKPLLVHLLSRLRQSKWLGGIVVATPDTRENDIIETLCREEKINCFRGENDDVLSRIAGALQVSEADVGVVVYGDNPIIDPIIVDEHIELFLKENRFDWLGNDLKTTFPPGMDVEVFSVDVLRDSQSRAVDPGIREHGTLHVRQNPSIYRLHNVEATGQRRRPDLYLGVDVPQDAIVLSSIINNFDTNSYYSLEEIIEFVDREPGLSSVNQTVSRRWKRYRSDF